MELILKTVLDVLNIEDDQAVELEGEDARKLCDLINKEIDLDGEEDNLAQYIYMPDLVTACYPRADFRDNQAKSIVKLTVTRELTDEEMESLQKHLYGQFLDGWGEGFDTNIFSVGGYRVYVYFMIENM